ncbi:MAG: phosphate signaling complex protein PhoU [Nitrospiraceae bacterium]|nr:phosphate signaling complex protein PhoU [Nitrospiraceae bacterium]
MSMHLRRAIEELKKKLLKLSTRGEESVRDSVRALGMRDRLLATQVIDGDGEIDDIEVEVEEECLKILALHQPVASDLRFIVATLKISNDLERVGDLAVNIAERTLYVAEQAPTSLALDFPAMAGKTQWMLKHSLDALVKGDVSLARDVCAADDEVDAMNREAYIQVQEAIKAQPEKVELLIHLLSISKHLERIADLATNIAEDIIYMIEGEIVRHQAEKYISSHPYEEAE